jgi:hypothetical protein
LLFAGATFPRKISQWNEIMSVEDGTSKENRRIADRLTAVRHGRFVGRRAELELFRSALQTDELPFVVLYIYGPGGIGKTTLLREYARIAAESGRPVVHLDARNVDLSPPGFLLALRQSMGLGEEELPLAKRAWPPNGVLLIDTYETLAPLDAWLRETFLPQLPAQNLVVIAGRNPPAPAWRTDIDWASLTHIVSLANLDPEDGRIYLAKRGVPDDRCAMALAFTHGHPLALALVADVLRRGDRLAAFDPGSEPDVVQVLLERLVQDVPSREHRLALEVCVLAWTTTEAMLADVLNVSDAHTLFKWLSRLSFVEYGPHGLFPHDLAREVLYADLRWRNANDSQRLIQRLAAYLYTRLEQAHGIEQQRIWFDLLNLYRHNTFFETYFEWATLGTAFAEPASDKDHATIVAMVQQHEGNGSAKIAHYWLRRQPAAFLIFRSVDGGVIGFMAQLTLHQATPEDMAEDPAVSAAWHFVQRNGPLRAGEEIVYLRFWMSAVAYQGVSPALNLVAINSSIYWTTHTKLAWNFIPTADPAFHEPHLTSIHIWRSPETDFEIDGRQYGVFAHDWRVEPAAMWLNIKSGLASLSAPYLPSQTATPSPPLLVLTQTEFAEAVRQALRDFTRLDRLAMNPLMRTRLAQNMAKEEAVPAMLQTLLREAVATLSSNAKDIKFHRAIWHTYFEPAPTQERAAELLNLPFNTYRYQLSTGLERIVDWLWQREIRSADH